LLRAPSDQARALADAIMEIKMRVGLCSTCFNLTEDDPCPICADPLRDRQTICVVEDAIDIQAIERTRVFKGLYHVLHGAISPMEGIGPDELKVRELLQRVNPNEIKEVVIATNPNMEGEVTATYLAKQLQPFGILVTRIGQGVPMGGDLEYADDMTLSRALEGRRPI
jgi:recombination protein RecR